jgi:hypothetical protein
MHRRQLNFSLVLPKTIDNDYKGSSVAKAVFYSAILFTIVRSLIHMYAPDGGALSIATIPLDSYAHAAADAVIYLFGVWGLSQLLMGVFYLIVGLKYRSLIPLMYIFIAVEYTMRIVIGHMKPLVTTGTAPGAVGNYVVVPLSVLMFFLSIFNEKTARG